MTPEELKIHKSGRDVIRYLDEKVPVQQKVKRMETVSNPYDLVRNPNDPKEKAYADYAIELMKMGDEARRVSRSIKPTPVSQQAKKIYEKEVKELDSELRLSKSNSPRERQAKTIAGIRSSQYIKDHPGMDYEHKSRVRDQELQKARDEVGARRHEIDITPKQWEAIQANAISSSKLKEILTYANEDKVRNLATPKDQKFMVTQAKINLMKQMYDSGMYTQKEIAEKFNISSSSVSQYVRS
jgi:DNA-binding MarR family transcriptional regulator